jgi:hypothetical protein
MKHNFIALAAYAVILLTQFFQLSPVNANENSSQFYGYKGDYYNISNDKIAYNGQTYLQNKFLMQNEKVSEQLTYIRPNIELDTLKIEKGRKFIVVSDRVLDAKSKAGLPVQFESVQKEYISYDKSPSKIIFKGRIERTAGPRFAGKSGTVKIKLEKISIDNITYPVNALISKVNDKNVMFNTLASRPIFIANLADTANNGSINSDWKDPCVNHLCETGNLYKKPIVFLGAAALQTADLLLSPVTALFKKGDNVYIPEKTYFEIKMNKDIFVLNI